MKLVFNNKKQESGDVWSFFFEPVEPVEWKAGQSIRLELPKPTWGYSERRFTISSAPYEKHVRITTRLSDSDFKQALQNLQPGAQIDGHNIEGAFVWEEGSKHKLLIAGGIGITPMRSMLLQAMHDNKKLNATLFYISKDKPPVFLDELEGLANTDFFISVTDQRFNLDPDTTLAPIWHDSIVYISGPENMVRTASSQLINAGLDKEHIKLDEFTL